MKLLAATAISVLALAAAVPALAGDPTQTANNTAKADQAIPGDQNLTNSDQTALNHRNTQAALNNQESVDQSGVTPGGQSGNQDLQSQNQTALNDQNAGQDQDDSQASGQTGMNGQMALNDQNNGTSAEDQATVD
ncbi:MAG TPA: hypothetical protein VG798_02485, partial [Rhizomicrobium sp.]|nr:hypothetical protein [Rhizomicrobium sp.]